ncbi:glycosyltransferase family 39 protein [Candidimonas sp. SYP-B2681]|uniref:ArnT family glycosyltransferase n=1 Tax=Candidimonas sp. SYP-B2681 TaxID=2497686 RepID=UPI000F87BC97|nr:glycosyltransferase family 39 protein [Candidimonas sp. SYP-B2681]RTZ45571.1 glycosyltransferase family 39 protein [Candidimonas sp. SYP-B2681]
MQHKRRAWWFLAAVLCAPLLSMALLPLTDTSEARYAEMARMMAESGDWITPWFAPGVPFWGKPPLAFWSQALSARLLGMNEFALRLPSWLVTLATVGLIYSYAQAWLGASTARLAAIVYSSCVLVFMMSGAVITDPFLALGTTLCMTGWAMAARRPSWFWRYSFFLGLAIGLLAKGPLIVVLACGAIVPWLIFCKSGRPSVKTLPWASGFLLTMAISLPWYVAAELKTPGFLHYFFVGEHFLRFVDAGWKGDLYGTAHSTAYGTIWYYWLQASFPWGLVAIGLLLCNFASDHGRSELGSALRDPNTSYLLAWCLFTLVFFTASGNILWTYVLPTLGGFSILLARALQRFWNQKGTTTGKMLWCAGIAPCAAVVLAVLAVFRPDLVKSERDLVNYAKQNLPQDEHLVFLEHRPFSARFYSRGTAALVPRDRLMDTMDDKDTVYIAVPRELIDDIVAQINRPVKKLFVDKRFVLIAVPPEPAVGMAPKTYTGPNSGQSVR